MRMQLSIPETIRTVESEPQAIDPNPRRNLGMGKDRFRFRAEQNAVPERLVKERLDAHAVADQQKFLLASIPDGKRIDADQLVDKVFTPLKIASQHDFGVAPGFEMVTAPGQVLTESDEVIHLTAIGQASESLALRCRLHWLCAALQVYH